MASVEFESSRPLLFPESSVTAARLRAAVFAPRPRLAMISTYSELCGIAAYTRHLERQLAEVFDIRVFDLNQYLLRATHRRVRRFADRHIQEICRELKDFDAVNLQLEHGTLGRTARRDLSPLQLDRARLAAAVGDLSHSVRPGALRLRPVVQGDFSLQLLRGSGDASGISSRPSIVGRDRQTPAAARSASSRCRSSSTPGATCGT